jgi:microcystin-dependent protein
LGTFYGGDGRTNFALPNLSDIALIGTGQGPGLPPQDLGGQTGISDIMLTSQQLPPDLSGSSQGFDNYQPSLSVSYIINLGGVYPAPDGGGGLDFLGEVVPFAGSFAPLGWAFANGQILPISENEALFSLIGTTYGGDGETTFGLPDLRGRDIVGASPSHPVGESFGQASVSLTNAQVPTSPGGSAQPFDNEQPSLAMTYLIALQGIFPSRDGSGYVDPELPYLGQANRPPRATNQTHDALHGRRLAGAVASHQRDHLAAPDAERDVEQNLGASVPGAQAFDREKPFVIHERSSRLRSNDFPVPK